MVMFVCGDILNKILPKSIKKNCIGGWNSLTALYEALLSQPHFTNTNFSNMEIHANPKNALFFDTRSQISRGKGVVST
jgi:hypothetical protein